MFSVLGLPAKESHEKEGRISPCCVVDIFGMGLSSCYEKHNGELEVYLKNNLILIKISVRQKVLKKAFFS